MMGHLAWRPPYWRQVRDVARLLAPLTGSLLHTQWVVAPWHCLGHLHLPHITRTNGHMLIQCWASVADGSPTLNHHRGNSSCLSSTQILSHISIYTPEFTLFAPYKIGTSFFRYPYFFNKKSDI